MQIHRYAQKQRYPNVTKCYNIGYNFFEVFMKAIAFFASLFAFPYLTPPIFPVMSSSMHIFFFSHLYK